MDVAVRPVSKWPKIASLKNDARQQPPATKELVASHFYVILLDFAGLTVLLLRIAMDVAVRP
eukprot:2986956-Amphidinium_carterae.1